MDAMREIDFPTARAYFDRVLRRDPRNLSALRQVFSIELQAGDHESLSEAANRLLKEMFASDRPHSEIRNVFLQYRGREGGIQLQPMVVLRLAHLFLDVGDAGRAERLLGLLLKNRPGIPGMPAMLLRLARLHHARGNASKYRACVAVLLKHYAESSEAAQVRGRPES
jgi:predicted Zn-dependent protease